MVHTIAPKNQFKVFQITTQSIDELNQLIVELIRASNGICQENGDYTKFKKSTDGKSILYNFERVDELDWIVLEPDGLAIYSNKNIGVLYSC